MNKTCLAVLALAMTQAAAALEITITPGSLAKDMVRLESTRDPELTLKGTANVTDLMLLHRVSDHVTSLDMSGLSIAAYTYTSGGYKGRMEFAAGELIPDMLAGTQVRQLTLPATATRIGNNALAHSSLTSVTVPANITGIDGYAFAGSRDLTSVTIQGDPSYGPGVFADCTALRTVATAHGIVTVTREMFRGCSSITSIPAGVRNIDAQAFRGSGLTHANLADVGRIGNYAFAEIPTLTSVTVGSGARFGTGVFYGNSGLQEVNEWCAAMSAAAAAHSGINVPLTVNTRVVEDGAFANNPHIPSVTLGNAVTQVKANAFRNDTGIQTVNVSALGAAVPATDPHAFAGLADENGRYPIRLTVLDTAVDVWKAAPVWQDFDITGISGVTSIDESDIKVSAVRTGDTVSIHSSVPMTSVSVYSITGTSVYTGGSGEYEVSVRIPSDEVFVVKVVAGTQMTVFKLR